MNKLDEILKCDWKVEINIGIGGYYIYAIHWNHSPVDVNATSLKDAISELYKKIWSVTK